MQIVPNSQYFKNIHPSFLKFRAVIGSRTIPLPRSPHIPLATITLRFFSFPVSHLLPPLLHIHPFHHKTKLNSFLNLQTPSPPPPLFPKFHNPSTSHNPPPKTTAPPKIQSSFPPSRFEYSTYSHLVWGGICISSSRMEGVVSNSKTHTFPSFSPVTRRILSPPLDPL